MLLQNPILKYKVADTGDYTEFDKINVGKSEVNTLQSVDIITTTIPSRPNQDRTGTFYNSAIDHIEFNFARKADDYEFNTALNSLTIGDEIYLQSQNNGVTFSVKCKIYNKINTKKTMVIDGNDYTVTMTFMSATPIGGADTEISGGESPTGNYVTTDTEQTVTGKKNFTGGLTVSSNAVLTSSDAYTKAQIDAFLAAKAAEFTVDGTTIIMDADRKMSAQVPSTFSYKGRENTVSELPTSGNKDGDMYFVGEETASSLDLYCYIDNAGSGSDKWVKVGTTAIDITKLVTTDTAQTITGNKTFTSNTAVKAITNYAPGGTSSFITISGDSGVAIGGRLQLFSHNDTSNTGGWRLLSEIGASGAHILEGTGDGKLTWDGKDISSGGSGPSEYIKSIRDNGDGSYTAINQGGSDATTWTIPEIPWEPIQTWREISYGEFTDNSGLAKHLNQVLYDTQTTEIHVETGEESGKFKIYQRSQTKQSDTEVNLYRCFIDGSAFKVEFIKWYTTDDFESCTWTSTIKTIS